MSQEELQDLCARRDIHDVVCNYARGLDRLMPELVRAAFHDDAHIDCGTFVGDADGFVAFAQSFLGSLRSSQHLLGQVHLRIQGRRAQGEVYFMAFHRVAAPDGDQDLIIAGRYVDEYEDRGTGWKIARRCLLVDWARTDPAADGFVRETAALVLGARGAADFSNSRRWPP